ncbi:MAG: hypothetical protein K0S34_1647 [Bacillales bacterium]|nr:hypothetical protein [Bacillales bacterium]
MIIKDEELYPFFQKIINKKLVEIVFQPIISLETGELFANEALTRGPKNSAFSSPLTLFKYAETTGHLYSLEKMTRELAIERSKQISNKDNKLFININASVIEDPSFTPGNTISFLKQFGISPSDIVFEITERTAISDFEKFTSVLEHYRNQGFLIAIDDAGAGYSSLQAISELEPDFIKIDRSLITNVNNNKIKANIVEAFTYFTNKSDSKIIAEGIETKEELDFLVNLGVNYGQGFFIAHPKSGKQEINHEIKESCITLRQKQIIEGRQHFVQPTDIIVVKKNHTIFGTYRADLPLNC